MEETRWSMDGVLMDINIIMMVFHQILTLAPNKKPPMPILLWPTMLTPLTSVTTCSVITTSRTTTRMMPSPHLICQVRSFSHHTHTFKLPKKKRREKTRKQFTIYQKCIGNKCMTLHVILGKLGHFKKTRDIIYI